MLVAVTLAVTVVVTIPVGAQDPVVRPPVDTSAARRDSIARRDSVTRDSVARDSVARVDAARQERARALIAAADTLKRPVARPEIPPSLAVSEPYAWDRPGLIRSGAFTLGELVDRIPGVTSYRAGWISAPEMAAVNGRFGRVRFFLDGVELDPLNSRLDGQHDLTLIDMFELEGITSEISADEVRVHLGSWRVNSTTPVTQIDIHTGDLQTNHYRGFFGRVFPGGQVVQVAGNHYATTDRRNGEAGDHTALWGRLGIARNNWSVDAQLLRSGRKFTERVFEGEPAPEDTVPTMDGIWTVAIGRAAWGDANSNGPWAQALLSAQSYSIRNPLLTVIDSIPGPGGGGPGGTPAEPDTLEVPNDTTQSRPQFVLTGGFNRGAVRVSALGRLRRWRGDMTLSPAARVAWASRSLTLSFFGERSPLDSLQRLEGSAHFNFGGRFAVSGTVSQFSPIEGIDAPTSLAVRAELGARVGRTWFTVGAVRRDTAFLPAAIAFDTSFEAGAQGQTNGLFATIRGKFYRDVGVDISAIRYEDAGIYRPQWQTRSRLYVDSDMRAKFPSGNLNILFAVSHEYRSQALFPFGNDFLESSQYRLWNAELVLRLLTASFSLQYRNLFAVEYNQVPGFTMPTGAWVYGISWRFFN
jgi:hypothetical protein